MDPLSAHVAASGQSVAGDGRTGEGGFFAQQHHPGRLSASDFVYMTDLAVTIQNQTFPHLLYHFVLTYSNWETGTVCFSESFVLFHTHSHNNVLRIDNPAN